MLAQMAYAGVDHAVLQAGFTYGSMNDYLALAQARMVVSPGSSPT